MLLARQRQTAETDPLSPATDLLEGVARAASRALARVGRWMEAHSASTLSLVLLLYLVTVLAEAHAHPLLNDEIYTLRIAEAPGLRVMWRTAREIDLHPPLHYLAERVALWLPGPVWLVARLPSIVAAGVATALLFRFTQRRLGALLAVISVAVLWTGPAQAFFWSNRPYALYLALLLLLQAAYLRSVRGGRSVWHLLATGVLSAAMIGDELVGIAALTGFLCAEAARLRRARRPDGALWLVLFAPAGLGLTMLYQLRHMGQNAFPADRMPSLGQLATTYLDQVTQLFFLLGVTAVLGVFLRPARYLPAVIHEEARPRLQDRLDLAFCAGLLLVPALLMTAAAALHIQYWERYSLCATIGFAELIPWVLYRRLPQVEVLGPLLVLLFVVTLVAQTVQDVLPARGAADRIALASLDPRWPVVDANPMTFMEMSHREPPSFAARVFYVTDRAEAARLSHYTLFENEGKIVRLLRLPSHAEDREQFCARYSRFWLVADPNNAAEWLLPSLVQHGALVAWKGKTQPGYDDSDLYLVQLPR